MRVLKLLTVALCAAVLLPGQSQPFTIDQAVQEALERNVRLLADRYDISIAEARILTARVRPNPVLSAQGQYLDVLGSNFALTNPAGPPEFNAGVSFTLEQLGKRSARVAVATAARDVAQTNFVNRTRQLVFDVQSAAVDLLAAQQSLEILRNTQASLETVVQLNTVRYKAGDLSQVELTRSEVAAIQFQNQVLQADTRMRAAAQRLQAIMGRAVADPQFTLAGPLRSDSPTVTLAELQAKALAARPDLQSAKRDIQRAAAEVTYQRKQTIGDTVFTAQYNKQWDLGILSGRSVTVGIAQPLPLFNRNRGEIERAGREREQAEARARALEFEVAAEVRNAYLQYTASRDQLHLIEASLLDRARRVRETIEYSYRRGEASFLELLEAQRAQNESLLNHANAAAEYARSLYLLESVTASGMAGQPGKP